MHREGDDSGSGERRHNPLAPRPVAQQHRLGPGDERDQRRVVDGAPVEVNAARPEIQLVTVVSVEPHRRQVPDERREREPHARPA